jgi:hypothetical protein
MRLMAAVAGLCAFVAVVAAAPAEVALRLRHEVGQTLRYRAQVSGTGTITMVGDEHQVEVRGRFTRVERTRSRAGPQAWEVEVATEDPSLTFRAGGERRTVTMQVPTLTQVVDDRGKVTAVRGWEAAAALLSAPGMGDAVRPLFGLVQVEGLPEHAVKPGDKWSAKAKLMQPDGSDLEVEQQFEFVGWEDDGGVPCAKLRTTTAIPVKRLLPAEVVGTQVTMEGLQRIETTSLLAYEQGVLLRQQTDIVLDLKTSTLLGPEAPEATVPGAVSLRVTVALTLQR